MRHYTRSSVCTLGQTTHQSVLSCPSPAKHSVSLLSRASRPQTQNATTGQTFRGDSLQAWPLRSPVDLFLLPLSLEQPQLSWLRQVPQLFFWFCELLIAFPSFLFLFKPGRINSCGFQTKDPNKPCGECSQRAGGTPCAFFIKTRCGLPLTATMCMA